MKPTPTSLLQPLNILGKGVVLCKSNNAARQKVKKVANLGTTNNVSGTSLTDYLGGYQYNNDVLQFFPHAQGYVKHTINPSNGASEFDYVYQYKDHLGNIRINYTFDTASSSLKILEENHYYPFGLKHQENLQPRSIRFAPSPIISNEWIKGVGYAEPPPPMAALVPNSGYQNKYNGKSWENELDLNLYDYGWRNYDPAIGRWINVDPLAEKFSDISPYTYVASNPIMFIDPDGRDITLPKGTSKENTYKILGSMQKLTNDKLVYSTQKDGSIKIKIASLGKGDKNTGTSLIRKLNSSDKNISIHHKNSEGNFKGGTEVGNLAQPINVENAKNGKGSDVIVNFNPDANPNIKTTDSKTGITANAKRPNEIGLVHELIHAEHIIDGDFTGKDTKTTNSYTDSSGKSQTQSISVEEARTVGLEKYANEKHTENKVREENKLNKRGAY